ncbi:MAG TPA: 4Fe-4S dicluster domain-containing protein [Thiobacillaceae bacterium]|nr:4Fe-4S dicluster domain-containing protein [Thiobacillaceae bacterium]HNF89935.1 4Fe-4S dicluster domain-containing protein [Thiobacillaceae bacterium]HNH87825.1 4Fe-4S dicluster domain-containing protein [Thiobacillaceae bacterium]HNI09193.1 4Fe-4S dicluster domain-containing protein [Thiobacillaceae bacterium]
MSQPIKQDNQAVESDRRTFLKTGAAVAGVVVAPGVLLYGVSQARAPEEGASSKQRWGLLIDTSKCGDGCHDCVTACNTENGLSGKTGPQDSQWIRKVDIKDLRTGFVQSLPMMCQHCEHPPCVDVCPTGASMKRADGIVLVDRHICIGCRYCMMACPYKARSFVHEPLHDQNPEVPRGQGCVESCTFCVQRVDRDEQPACVEACNAKGHQAMVFGDLKDPESAISKALKSVDSTEVRGDLGLNTGVRYQGI